MPIGTKSGVSLTASTTATFRKLLSLNTLAEANLLLLQLVQTMFQQKLMRIMLKVYKRPGQRRGQY